MGLYCDCCNKKVKFVNVVKWENDSKKTYICKDCYIPDEDRQFKIGEIEEDINKNKINNNPKE